jgi:hypothetical protein
MGKQSILQNDKTSVVHPHAEHFLRGTFKNTSSFPHGGAPAHRFAILREQNSSNVQVENIFGIVLINSIELGTSGTIA